VTWGDPRYEIAATETFQTAEARVVTDGLDALERFERDAGFEFWFVSSSFCFHFCGSGWGFCPLPTITIIA
jgi:hypothetical protein